MVDTHTAEGFNLKPQEIDRLEQESGEKNLRGRTGGAVTLALGIAKIFDGIPGLSGFMKYWYHFAIMFEALFILTTIDTGTRVARFLVGEFGGQVLSKARRTKLAAGFDCHICPCGRSVGCFHLVRINFNNLADVWHRQSTARIGRPVCCDHDDRQLRKSQILVGDNPASQFCRQHNSCRRLEIHNRHLLATNAKPRDFTAGLHQCHAHSDHYGRGDRDSD